MKGNFVYVVHIRQVCDFEFLRDDCEVFASLEDAQKMFKSFVEDERKYVERDEWEIESDDDTTFEAFVDGEYSSNHTYASIETLEIN